MAPALEEDNGGRRELDLPKIMASEESEGGSGWQVGHDPQRDHRVLVVSSVQAGEGGLPAGVLDGGERGGCR